MRDGHWLQAGRAMIQDLKTLFRKRFTPSMIHLALHYHNQVDNHLLGPQFDHLKWRCDRATTNELKTSQLPRRILKWLRKPPFTPLDKIESLSHDMYQGGVCVCGFERASCSMNNDAVVCNAPQSTSLTKPSASEMSYADRIQDETVVVSSKPRLASCRFNVATPLNNGT